MTKVGRCQSQATSHKNSLPATMPGGRRVAQSGYLCQQMFSSVVFMKFVYIGVQSVKLEPSCGPFLFVVATFAMWGSPSGSAAFFVKLPCCSLERTVNLFPVTFAEHFIICGYWAFALSMPSMLCSVATRSFAGLNQAMGTLNLLVSILGRMR